MDAITLLKHIWDELRRIGRGYLLPTSTIIAFADPTKFANTGVFAEIPNTARGPAKMSLRNEGTAGTWLVTIKDATTDNWYAYRISPLIAVWEEDMPVGRVFVKHTDPTNANAGRLHLYAGFVDAKDVKDL